MESATLSSAARKVERDFVLVIGLHSLATNQLVRRNWFHNSVRKNK